MTSRLNESRIIGESGPQFQSMMTWKETMSRYNGKVIITAIGPGRGSGFLIAKAPFPYNTDEWYFLNTLAEYELHENQAKKASLDFE